MNEPQANNSYKNFFKYFILGFFVSLFKVNLIGVSLLGIVKSLFITFMYSFTVGIWTGLAVMFGVDIYWVIKKNLKNNEQQFNW